MQPKKMGRPPSDNPKSETVRVRIDVATAQKLDDCSRAFDTNRSEIIRKGIDRIFEDLNKK